MNHETMEESKIRHYGDIVCSCLVPQDMRCSHRCPTHSLVFVRSGKMLVEDDDTSLEILAGSCAFIRRNCTVRITKTSDGGHPYQGIFIKLQRDELKDYYTTITKGGRQLPHDAKPISDAALLLPLTPAMEGLFNSLLPYIDRDESPTEEMLELKVTEAIMCVLATDRRFYPTLFDFNETWKIDILDFMEQNLTEDLSLEEFASYTGRSLATFKRDFAKISDTTPQKWLIEHRLEMAHDLLAKGGLQTTDVAYRVGFKNRSHFSSAFKRRYGYAPSSVPRAV